MSASTTRGINIVCLQDNLCVIINDNMFEFSLFYNLLIHKRPNLSLKNVFEMMYVKEIVVSHAQKNINVQFFEMGTFHIVHVEVIYMHGWILIHGTVRSGKQDKY